MPEHYSRADWAARPARPGPGLLKPSEVVGSCLHWPATTSRVRTKADVARSLRGWQAYHMDELGWSDIAYNVAVDQLGNRWELRGVRQSGANGSEELNEHYFAILIIVAQGEELTPECVAEVRNVIADARLLYSKGRVIVGHGEIRPGGTQCPGPAVEVGIARGTFEPRKAPDEPEPGRIEQARINVRQTRRLLREARETAVESGQDTRAGRIDDMLIAVRAAARAGRKFDQ